MALRFGPGPVFVYEWISRTRRWQGYALRALVVFGVFVAIALAWSTSTAASQQTLLISQIAEIGRGLYIATILSLLAVVGLSAPAATAGAICIDKARGNLALVFATDLSSAEVILGKLATRLIPVLGTVACITPVLAITISFGGVDPEFVFGSLLVVATCAVFGCCLALALSVWGRKTHEVLMGTYAFGILYLLAAPIWFSIFGVGDVGWILYLLNPVILVILPVEPGNVYGWSGLLTDLIFVAIGLGASIALVVLSIVSVRSVAIAHLSEKARSLRQGRIRRLVRKLGRGLAAIPRFVFLAWGFLPTPTLDRNPVLWRELHRKAPSRWTMIIWGLYIVVVGTLTAWAIVSILQPRGPGRFFRWGEINGPIINGLQIFAAFLLLSATSATGLAEERQRGSLDVLMATPLSTARIVWAKWWASYRIVPLLAIMPVVLSLFLRNSSRVVGLTAQWTAVPVLLLTLIVGIGLAVAWRVAPRWRRSIRIGLGLGGLVILGMLATILLESPASDVFMVALLGPMILASGASLISLGLLIATWLPRLGAASALSVALYLLGSIAWPILMLILFESDPLGPLENAGEQLACWSPFFGVLLLSANEIYGWEDQAFITLVGVVLTHCLIAAVLLGLILLSFNRCLGRIDDPLQRDWRRVRGDRSPRPAIVSHHVTTS